MFRFATVNLTSFSRLFVLRHPHSKATIPFPGNCYGQNFRSGVVMGWTTPLLLEVIPEIDANPMTFLVATANHCVFTVCLYTFVLMPFDL